MPNVNAVTIQFVQPYEGAPWVFDAYPTLPRAYKREPYYLHQSYYILEVLDLDLNQLGSTNIFPLND